MTLKSTLLPDLTIFLLKRHSKSLRAIAHEFEVLGDTKRAERLRDDAQQLYQRAKRLELRT